MTASAVSQQRNQQPQQKAATVQAPTKPLPLTAQPSAYVDDCLKEQQQQQQQQRLDPWSQGAPTQTAATASQDNWTESAAAATPTPARRPQQQQQLLQPTQQCKKCGKSINPLEAPRLRFDTKKLESYALCSNCKGSAPTAHMWAQTFCECHEPVGSQRDQQDSLAQLYRYEERSVWEGTPVIITNYSEDLHQWQIELPSGKFGWLPCTSLVAGSPAEPKLQMEPCKGDFMETAAHQPTGRVFSTLHEPTLGWVPVCLPCGHLLASNTWRCNVCYDCPNIDLRQAADNSRKTAYPQFSDSAQRGQRQLPT